MRMLAAGRSPVDVPLSDLCAAAGVSKGSFYAHFPAGVEAFHDELLVRWLAGLRLPELADDMRIVRDPSDRLRLLVERVIAVPGIPGAIQRWAAASAAVAQAVADAEQVLAQHAARALADVGLAGDDARLLGHLLIRPFLPAGEEGPSIREQVDALVRCARGGLSAAWDLQAVALQEVQRGDAPGVILFQSSPGLTDGDQQELSAQVQEFVRSRRAASGPAQAAGSAG